jgi:hypothetical protein
VKKCRMISVALCAAVVAPVVFAPVLASVFARTIVAAIPHLRSCTWQGDSSIDYRPVESAPYQSQQLISEHHEQRNNGAAHSDHDHDHDHDGDQDRHSSHDDHNNAVPVQGQRRDAEEQSRLNAQRRQQEEQAQEELLQNLKQQQLLQQQQQQLQQQLQQQQTAPRR